MIEYYFMFLFFVAVFEYLFLTPKLHGELVKYGVKVYVSNTYSYSSGVFFPYIAINNEELNNVFIMNHEIGHCLHYHRLLILIILLTYDYLLDLFNVTSYLFPLLFFIIIFQCLFYICELDADIFASFISDDNDCKSAIKFFQQDTPFLSYYDYFRYYIDYHPSDSYRITLLQNRKYASNIFSYYTCGKVRNIEYKLIYTV